MARRYNPPIASTTFTWGAPPHLRTSTLPHLVTSAHIKVDTVKDRKKRTGGSRG